MEEMRRERHGGGVWRPSPLWACHPPCTPMCPQPWKLSASRVF